MRLIEQGLAEPIEEVIAAQEEATDVAAGEIGGCIELGHLSRRQDLPIVIHEVGLDLLVQIQLVLKGIGVASSGYKAIQVRSLRMRGISVGGVAINEDGEAKVQGDKHFPLGVGDA